MLDPAVEDCIDKLYRSSNKARMTFEDIESVYNCQLPNKAFCVMVRKHPTSHYSVDLIFSCKFVITPVHGIMHFTGGQLQNNGIGRWVVARV